MNFRKMKKTLIAECNGVKWSLMENNDAITYMVETATHTHHYPIYEKGVSLRRFGGEVLEAFEEDQNEALESEHLNKQLMNDALRT